MNDLVLYKSENFQGIECDFWKDENNNIFMTAEQLGTVLGYSHPRKAINKIALRNEYLLNSEFSAGTKMVPPVGVKMTFPSGTQETRVFTEDGIYEVTMLAKTERAKEFRSWVRQILKGIRKGELEILQKRLEEVQPKLQLYEQLMAGRNSLTMLQASKALKLSGRNKLFAYLRSKGILMTKSERHNLPYQQYIDAQLFEVVIKTLLINKEVVNVPVTLVTPKGLKYIYKLLQKEKALQHSKAS